ncbi:heterokaryon incompatibility protein-domain-containing protein, partial [Plectosphaerella plurivora]
TRLWLGPRADTPFTEDPSLVAGLVDYSDDSSRASWPTLAWTRAHRLHDIKTLCDGCAALDVTALVEGAPPTKMLDDFKDIEKNAGRCRLCALMAQTYRGVEGVHYRQNFVYKMNNRDIGEGPVMVYKTEGHLEFGVLMPGDWPDSQQGSSLFPWEFGRFAIEVPVETEQAVADTSAEARALVLRRELQRTSSEAGWCSSCAPNRVASTSHGPSAATHVANPLLPYRVVEILGSPETLDGLTKLRLKTSEPNQAEHAAYATLSHRWGGVSTLKTTKETLPDRTLGFLLSEMPRTFQDAVLVASALGFRYVWIDSLCIVQDDEVEWREQSAVMGAIYMNASLTIAAHSAAQCNEGFLWRSQVPSCLRIPSIPAAFSLSLPFLESSQLRRRFFESEIAKRAWVLQELTLSRRILHFVEDHVFWECEHACGVPARKPPEGDGMDSSLEGLNLLPAATSAAIFRTATSTLSIHSAWLGLVQRYSEYHMTQKGDKLVAVSGIANVLRQAYRNMSSGHWELGHDDYHCGIFAGDVPRSLLWFNNSERFGNEIERHLERAPTWSWASVDCVLSFPALALDTDGDEDEAEPLVMLRFRSCRHRSNVGLPGRGPSCQLVVEAPLF